MSERKKDGQSRRDYGLLSTLVRLGPWRQRIEGGGADRNRGGGSSRVCLLVWRAAAAHSSLSYPIQRDGPPTPLVAPPTPMHAQPWGGKGPFQRQGKTAAAHPVQPPDHRESDQLFPHFRPARYGAQKPLHSDHLLDHLLVHMLLTVLPALNFDGTRGTSRFQSSAAKKRPVCALELPRNILDILVSISAH